MHKDDRREVIRRATTMDQPCLVGIDIAKATYQVSLCGADGKRRHKSFPNTPGGHAALLAWLARHDAGLVHACLESTGTYSEAVATALAEAGHCASIVNPAAVKAFAQSQLRRTKTDRVDADVLVDFCRAHQPPAWTPWPREVRTLQALVRRRDAVQGMLTEEQNRRQAGELVPRVAASLTRHIRVLEAELEALDREIRDHLDQHPTLRAQRELLCTIPGIGEATVARLLAECRAITDFETARAYAAFAGLVPRERRSGTLRGRPHLSKLGSSRLRFALYFPAITAIRHNPVLRAFSARLRAAGKHPLVVIAAVMRKLLHIVYGVLKHQRPFDPTLVSA
jgi:transposase